MAIIVEVPGGYERIDKGVTASADAAGHLTVLDDRGWVMAVYSPGKWDTAAVEGQRTEVDEEGEPLS